MPETSHRGAVRTISHAHARLLAYFWEEHDRPDFSVTVLARTGAIRYDTEPQLARDLMALDAAAEQSSDPGMTICQLQIGSLLDYVRQNGLRDAVKGWRELRDDGEFQRVTVTFARRRMADLASTPTTRRRTRPAAAASTSAPILDEEQTAPRSVPPQDEEQTAPRSVPPHEEESEDKSLFDRLGGDAAVRAAVDSFYEKVLGDDRIAYHFEGINTGRLKAHQRAFITAVTGGPQDEYADLDAAVGRLTVAHERLKITRSDFNIVVSHLAITLTELGVEAGVIEQLMPRVLKLRDVIVNVGEVHPFHETPEMETRMTDNGSRAQTIYDLVGDEGVRGAVDLFYEKVLADPRISGYFEDISVPRLKAHQRAFISAVVGGPNDYTGRSMEDAHSRLQINNDHFDIVVAHLVATLTELGVPDEHVNGVAPSVLALREDIVTA